MKEINLLELFSGIGGFTKGFQRAGYTIKKHYFSEIDKHAIANYKYNFKDAEYIGSVTDVRGRDIERPDIITFGSPCQDFSLAGKRAGLEGKRSNLVMEAIRLITETKPSVFIWENVKGSFSSNNGADFWAIIAAFANIGGYRLEWQLLNTSWVLPQNRERIYLIGHLAGRSEPGVFPFSEIDRRINEGANEATNIRCLTAGGHSGGMHSSMTLVKHRSDQPFKVGGISPTLRNSDKGDCRIVINSNTKQGYEIAEPGDSINFSVPTSKTRRGRVGKGTAQTLDTACNQGVLTVVGNVYKSGGQAGKIYDAEGISPVVSGQRVNSQGFVQIVKPVLTPDRLKKRQNGRRFKEDGEPAFTLGCQDQHGVMINNNIRRLTEIECERLQGFPDDWTKYGNYDGIEKIIPKSQRYKLIGNAVTVDIVELIANKLNILTNKI